MNDVARPGRTPDRSVPASVVVAVAGTWISAVILVVVGVGVIATGHSVFGTGVGAMLVCYALLVGLVGWAALRARGMAEGMLVASGLLHTVVLVSLQRAGGPEWFWALAVIPVAVVVAALLPASRAWLHD